MSRLISLLTVFLISDIVVGQAIEVQIQKIRNDYIKVRQYINSDDEARFMLDMTGEGGGLVYSFHTNADRLYLVEEEGGYEEGGTQQTEYYFNEANDLFFIYQKYDYINYFGGEHTYKELRVYVSNGKIIRQLIKEINSKDFDEVEEFKTSIDGIKNEEVEPSASDLTSNAKKLKEIWKIANGL